MWVCRTVSDHDRRQFDVSLTPEGRRRFGQIWPEHADGIGRYFVQPLAGEPIPLGAFSGMKKGSRARWPR
jgi:DNA-binding MarR family transcriptional regulator